MVNLKKWMAKVSVLLKKKTLTYTKKTVTTSQYGTAKLDIYTTNERVIEISTATTDGDNQIVVMPLLVGSAYWVKCTNANTGNIVANTPVLVQLVTCPVSFFEGGVISYLIHLTESLKSFCGGRRWAYAEPQESADKAVREADGIHRYSVNVESVWERRQLFWITDKHDRRTLHSLFNWKAGCKHKLSPVFRRWSRQRLYKIRCKQKHLMLLPAPERGWWCA